MVDVRLQEDEFRDRHRRPDPAFRRIDASDDAGRRFIVANRYLRGDQQRLRSQVQCAKVNHALDFRSRLDGGHDRGLDAGAGRFADKQALHFCRQHHRHAAEQYSDRQRARPVPSVIVGDCRQGDADQGKEQAAQRRDVLQQDGRQFGSFGVADEAAPAGVAATRACLTDGGAQRERLEHDRNTKHSESHNRGSERLRVHDALDAFVARERAADDEQHHGNKERVEVTLSPEAKWVLLCPGTPRPGAAEQQQDLITGVGDRVNGFRQERRGAGDGERGELTGRYAQVRTQCGDYGALAPVPVATGSVATGTATAGSATTGTTAAAEPGSRRIARGD